ncbi:hypothetical protein KKG51_03890, partial [Patescibacteria group bacterium]|nr:hypothetical protein [Patescibacteria group bacterium]
INNIGKSTHAQMLTDRLNQEGHDAVFIKYPVYDLEPTGPYLNKVLRVDTEQKISEEELQMWFTLNRYQFEPQLKKYLDEGKIVVAEDYTGTGLAWGSLKGAYLPWLTEMNKYLLKEDLGILLEGARSLSAKEEDHIHEADDELVEKCKRVLDDLGNKYNWGRVEICEKREDTHEGVWKLVKEFLGS